MARGGGLIFGIIFQLPAFLKLNYSTLSSYCFSRGKIFPGSLTPTGTVFQTLFQEKILRERPKLSETTKSIVNSRKVNPRKVL